MKVEEIKLHFQKLNEQRLQLADINTLKSDAVRMNKGISDLNSMRQQMKQIYLKAIDKANTNRGDFGQKAKELGFDPNTIPEYKNYFTLQEKLDSAYYEANK